MPRWRWILLLVARRLWVRATLIGMLGILSAAMAALAENVIPWQVPKGIGVESVDVILKILASSMLSVTTFSLSIMTAAYASATSNVTPRAIKLLLEDKVTQNALSTFLGSFLFSIVGIVVLQIGAYGERGKVMMFGMTVVVIALIVVALLRWIDHLTRLGRVGETTERVEEATRDAIRTRMSLPYLGGVALTDEDEIPDDALHVDADAIGYVQHVDMTNVNTCCEELDADIYLAAQPGDFVYPRQPLAWIVPTGALDKKDEEKICDVVATAFTIDQERTFDQDPRFGFAVLSEIAIRAMSPGINDPGTAIDVIGRATRLLARWAERGADHDGGDGIDRPNETAYGRIHALELSSADLFDEAFMRIARDGASMVEVQLHLQRSLRALATMGDDAFKDAARYQLELAQARADAGLALDADKQRLRELG